MIDKFHVMYMYRKIQAEASTTDIKTLEQLLKKFCRMQEEYYLLSVCWRERNT